MTPGQPLLGERLRLDRLGDQPADAVEILDFASRNKSHLARWLPPLAPNYYTEKYWHDAVKKSVESASKDESVDFVIREPALGDDASLVGVITFSEIARGAFQACYLGYSLDYTRQGRGLMQEALHLAIRFAFDDLSLHRIMANYRPENIRSAKTLCALGFVTEGVAKNYLYIDGAWRDHVLTALTNPNAQPGAV